MVIHHQNSITYQFKKDSYKHKYGENNTQSLNNTYKARGNHFRNIWSNKS